MNKIFEITPAALEFTGERFVPEISGEIALEHFHRYALAQILANGLRVLDIACGEGYGSAKLAEVANAIVGVDISLHTVGHASARYKKSNLRFLVATADMLPFGDESFDMVVSFETIEHLDKQNEMLSEIRRVLTKDGILFMSSPNKRNYSEVTGNNNAYHVKELYRDELSALLKLHFSQISFGGQRTVHGSMIAFDDFSETSTRLRASSTVNEFFPIYDLAIATNGSHRFHLTSFFEGAIENSDYAKLLSSHIHELQSELDSVLKSRSWAIAKPLRWMAALIRRLF